MVEHTIELVGLKANSLFQETPPPRRVRVMGRLDMIRASDGGFALCLEAGERVFGVWESTSIDILNRLWNQDVVVEGDAVFRASGKLLRLDAQAMAPATESDAFFATMPRPVLGRIALDSVRERQTQRTGRGAVFGQWPGDESEEELPVALGEMS